jgi:hypothetical protein
MSKKKKFDLTHLVHSGLLKDGEVIQFVSDPSKSGTIMKQPNGEYKVKVGKEIVTIHSLAQRYLGQEPPNHASYWFKVQSGKTLYELWQGESDEYAQAA